MTVIDLVSSEKPNNQSSEIIEILSSSPPATPNGPRTQNQAQTNQHTQRNSDILTSSPLFDFEQRGLQYSPVQSPVHSENHNAKDNNALSPSPKRRKLSNTFESRSENLDVRDEPLVATPHSNTDTIMGQFKDSSKDPFKENTKRLPKAPSDPEFVLAARKEDTEVVPPKRRPQFRPSSSSSSAAAVPAKTLSSASASKVAAASKASDRKNASERLVSRIWVDKLQWKEKIQEEFHNLEVSVTCVSPEEPPSLDPPEGVTLFLSVHGNFDDVWDHELGIFVKCEPHIEHMNTSIVSIEASYLDTLGNMSLETRDEYFAQVQTFASQTSGAGPDLEVLYVFPEIGTHFRKRVDAFNRAMRRLVASGESGTNTMSPPDEHFYTNLEAELQIMNDIRAFYPRKPQEAAEMVANCIVDFGVSRYRMHMDETHDIAGAYVRSKSTAMEITIESLTKIQGLPPRIAAKMGSEVKTLGGIRNSLGTNAEMRESRIKRFGQGAWNSSLLSFLDDEDPNRII